MATAEQNGQKRRGEAEGILHFSKDIVSALFMALIAIVYVIQAFRIPTGSMEKSLLAGDFLLGLKFMYGSPVVPFSFKKFPGVVDPKPGDVIIFKFPGLDKKDYIKRCVAGPGDTLSISGTSLFVNGNRMRLPPRGQYVYNGNLPPLISNYAPVRIPARGDTLPAENLNTRDLLFLKYLIAQEHPRADVSIRLHLYIDSLLADTMKLDLYNPRRKGMFRGAFSEFTPDSFDNWLELHQALALVKRQIDTADYEIESQVLLDGRRLDSYVTKFDAYFMMGDNRDQSADSRYWGFLSRNFIKAKAFILYFSLDPAVPWIKLPMKIRWNRIGKLILSWDGKPEDQAIALDQRKTPGSTP